MEKDSNIKHRSDSVGERGASEKKEADSNNARAVTAEQNSKNEAKPAATSAGKSIGSLWISTNKILLLGAVLALAIAIKQQGMSKKQVMQAIRDTIISMQVLRSYGPVGWAAFVLTFVAMLISCMPGTMVVDVALGNIYGVVFGTIGSILAKLISALAALFIGRRFGKALGYECPELLKAKMATVRSHPFKCLLAARAVPISTGVKNYAFSLLPSAEVPLIQYTAATVVANLFFTTATCIAGAGADSLVAALDSAMGRH